MWYFIIKNNSESIDCLKDEFMVNFIRDRTP